MARRERRIQMPSLPPALDEHGPLRLSRAAAGRVLADLNHRLGAPATRWPDGTSAVLMYHSVGDERLPMNVPVAQLEAMLAFCSRSSRIELVDLPGVVEPSRRTRKVALTFDDGFVNFYTRALPLLEKYGAPATVFVNPGFVGDARRELLQRRHGISVDGRIVLSEPELRALVSDPLVTIGNHTDHHPRLDELPSERAAEEIRAGKRALESAFDISVTRFAYPYGRYDGEAVDVVRDTHDFAVAIGPGVVTRRSDVHLLPRVLAHQPPREVRWRMTRLNYRFSLTDL